jgi:hypothetical protein
VGKHKRLLLVCAVLAVVLAGLGIHALVAQQVQPQQQVNPVQWNQPGNPFTLQTAFAQQANGTTGTVATTIAALAGKTIYLTGLEVTGTGATAATVSTVTVVNSSTTIGNYYVIVPAGATSSITPLIIEFTTPLVALAPGTSMVVQATAFGAGATNVGVSVHGYYQ